MITDTRISAEALSRAAAVIRRLGHPLRLLLLDSDSLHATLHQAAVVNGG